MTKTNTVTTNATNNSTMKDKMAAALVAKAKTATATDGPLKVVPAGEKLVKPLTPEAEARVAAAAAKDKAHAAKKLTELNEDSPAEEVEEAITAAHKESKAGKATKEAEKPLPFGGKQAAPFKTLGDRDAFGFGQDTETSWLLARLLEGKRTKPQLLAEFLKKFVPDGNASDCKRKKTSFSVFFSDVRKPFATYHASRSLDIQEHPETHVLTLSPESVKRAKKAIADKILDELRGLRPDKHASKIDLILKKHHCPALIVKG